MWSEAEAEGLNSYSCPTCGAELVCDETTAATTCPYCGNPTVLGGKLSGKLEPEYILPFMLDKKAAIAQLTRYYKGKAFLPKAFKSQNHIAEIQGVYVPFWLYDAKADARAGTRARTPRATARGDYMVTTTQHYDVRREGSAAFAKVPVDGSSKMPNTHMDAIEPFDYGDLKPFSTAYLPGYLADRYDEDADACAERLPPDVQLHGRCAPRYHRRLQRDPPHFREHQRGYDPRPLRPAAGLDAPHPVEGQGLPVRHERADRAAHR